MTDFRVQVILLIFLVQNLSLLAVKEFAR